jgi:type IV pilus assembly protein PilY1
MRSAVQGLMLAVLGLLTCAASAEDIDIYFGSASGGNSNVLIVLDNTSNWSAANQNWPTDPECPVGVSANTCNKQGYWELKALKEVIRRLPSSDPVNPMAGDSPVNVGLMLFNPSNSERNGGYVRSAMRPMTAANKARFISTIDDVIRDFNNEQGPSSGQYAVLLFDAFKYFGGYSNPANATADRAPSTNPSFEGVPVFGTRYWGTIDRVGGRYDPDAYNGDHYVAADSANDDCGGKNAIIFIGNGFPSSDTSPLRLNEALQKLRFPGESTPVSQLPLPTPFCRSTWQNLAGFSCQASADCGIALPGDTETTIFQCAKSNCQGNNVRAQSCSPWSFEYMTPTGTLKDYYVDGFADFLYGTDVSGQSGQQNVVTHAIDVCKDKCSANQSSLLRAMAYRGKGKYYKATSYENLVEEMGKAFLEVTARNSVFVSASLPVSVNTQGTYLNQVYMGMFRPDQTGSPRWVGNLKRYKFAYDSGTDSVSLVDANGILAVNSSTGFVSPNAQSIWSHSSKTAAAPDGFWANDPQGMATAPHDRKDDIPDGEIVEKGGVAGRIRTDNLTSQASRDVYTCPAAGCSAGERLATSKFDLGSNGILDASHWSQFGVSSESDFSALIRWIRGADNKGDEKGPGGTVTVRPSVHGDVLHSRPVALNYASLNKVVVFYGSNDGLLRAIDAGKADGSETVSGLQAHGKELWSFIAPEHFGQFKRLRDGDPTLQLNGFGEKPKDYFFDGSPGVYQEGNQAWLFVPARRGGRFIYAFDVSVPSDPKFMWKIDHSSAGFSELGQTWSTPKVTKLRGPLAASDGTVISAGEPVLIFGAGYAGGFNAASPYSRIYEDVFPPDTSYAYSRGIYVVQARTGKLIRFFQSAVSGSITRSVPSDVTLVDQNFDGYTDTAYVGDLGGNLWRMDLDKFDGSENNAANWTLTRIGALDGKFFYPPDVVLTSGFSAVLIGSGDREDPKRVSSQDHFYMIKDTGSDSALSAADLVDASLGGVPLSAPGWKFALRAGEKVVNAALTVGGNTYFGTNQPDPTNSLCTGGLGIARAYAVPFLADSAPVSTVLVSGGLPPSPVAGIVEITDADGSSKLVPFIIGAGTGGSPIEAEKINVQVPPVRKRIYWYSNEDH